MRKTFPFLLLFIFIPFLLKSQASIDTAVNFNIKALDGTTINLFQILDEENKIVVIDFFSVTCGPCQEYAPDFQSSYLDFGENSGNVFFMGINYGATNDQVAYFDETFGITYPTVSGVQGGGNDVYEDFGILSYPTVVIIDPETHELLRKEIYPPTHDSINNAVIKAGGIMTGNKEKNINNSAMPEIFPNPAVSNVTIDLNTLPDSDVKIIIYDLTGKIVYSKKQSGTTHQKQIRLNTKFMNEGIYFVNIIFDNNSYLKKLIVSKQ